MAVAESLIDLGDLDWYRDDLGGAADRYRQALAVLQSIAPESLPAALVLNNLAVVANISGDLSLAESLFERSLVIYRALAPDSPDFADALNNFASLLKKQGDLDQAEDLYQRVLAIRRAAAPESLAVAASYNSLGSLAMRRGDLSRAVDLHQRALAIREQLAPESSAVAVSLNNLAVVALYAGELERAEDHQRRALAIQQRLSPGGLGVARSLNNLGGVAEWRGDLDRAADYHQRALAIRRRLNPDSDEVAMSLSSLGTVALGQEDPERAAGYYRRALAIYRSQAPETIDVARSLTNLGTAALRADDLSTAADLFRRAGAIWKQLAPESVDMAANQENLGAVALQRGDFERAAEHHQRAMALRQALAPDSLDFARSLNSLATVAERRGDLDRALLLRQQAMEILERLAPESTEAARTLHALARLYRRKTPRELTHIDDLLRRAVASLEAQFGRLGGAHEVRAGFLAEHRDLYRDAIEVRLQLGQPDAAFHTLEASRARAFLEQLVERDTVFRSDLPEELDRQRRRVAVRYDRAQRELDTLSPRDDAAEVEAVHQKLRELRDEAHEVEAAVRRASPQLAALRYPRPYDLEAARSALDAGTLMLSYSVGVETTDLFVVSSEGPLEVHSLAVGEEELRRDVARFQSQIYGQGWSRRSASRRELAARLYATLIEPAEPVLQKSDRILLIPDGPLHRLPFAALVRSREADQRRLQYLVEWKPLHSVLSTTVYGELRSGRRQESPGKSPPTAVRLVAFGDPHYPSQLRPARRDLAADAIQVASPDRLPDAYLRAMAERGSQWTPLPHSRREVEAIAGLYPEATAYLGAAATEERAKAIGREVSILHFATHGTLDSRIPLNSAVALTIPESLTDGRDNGLLQAWEILEQVRLDADLVVLSACESGLGKEVGGEGLVGLTRAFQYAGARTVAATLWRVADQTTAALMERFYRYLRQGLAKDEALRQAQLDLIRGTIEVVGENGNAERRDAAAPYYWAAFQLYGDWR